MSEPAYLDIHPPASRQFNEHRREPISGIVFVHSAESVMDDVGVDTGAENVAGFISRRTDPGSYHVLVDSDSDIDVVRDECEAYQVAANGHNRHGWGISVAASANELDPDSWWTRAVIVTMGRKIREFWLRNGFDPKRAAHWIGKSEADARNGPGVITHGDVQPGDRSDAWTNHPQRTRLNAMLIQAIIGADPDHPLNPPHYHRSTMGVRMRNKDGRVETIALSPDGSLSSSWEPAPGQKAGPYTVISPEGSPKFTDISAIDGQIPGEKCPTPDGRLAVHLAGPYGSVWGAWQDGPGGGWQIFQAF